MQARKIVPPLYLALALWLVLLPDFAQPLPTMANSLQGNLIQNLDESFRQQPALEETIHEVQRILNQDPSLPRLTRGEIEELYEKVTKEEYEKSVEAGDKVRADSMRALMLVLPFNTDNNTEENLQELFTRPPVTKVVDTYSSHQPIQFLTPSMNNEGKFDAKIVGGQLDATTYKPSFSIRTRTMPLNPTTYHPPNPPAILHHMTPTVNKPSFVPFKPLVTHSPQSFEYNSKPVQRFSSHYSAKNADFLKGATEKKKHTYFSTSTFRPVADVLHSLGIVGGNTQTKSRIGLDDFYVAESAPKPSIVSVADLKGVRGQSLGPQIKADAYSMFKPLNIGEEIRVKPEVEDYLTRFGIVGGRKRKAIKKNEALSSTQNSLEPLSQESEISSFKVPSSHVKAKKGATQVGSRELEKLLENLKELERLNVSPQAAAAAATPTRVPPMTTTIATTTTTTTTPASTSLITNGEPLLVQPKKPRRRIDPNIDVNFGNNGNHQTESNHTDELSKLLENLQELEKLKISPERALKPPAAAVKGTNPSASRNVPVETPAPVQASALANRFSQAQAITPQQQLLLFQQQAQTGATTPDLDQLQKVLQQLQLYERNNAKTTSTTTTTTTTKRPIIPQASAASGPTDLWQLRKLLADDGELEKLFEQAKARQQLSANSKANSATTASSWAKTTTSTTRKPANAVNDLMQLQRYLAELEKSTSTVPTTTSRSIILTTTPRTLPTRQYAASDYDDNPKKLSMESRELQALINRVQYLERLQQKEQEKPTPTDTPLPLLSGFTTRNVKAPSQNQADYRLPLNDFANLRTLYKQVEDADKLSQGEIEISTKATAVQAYQEQQLETATRKAQNFAQRLIDITNDTGSGSSLQEVDPNDFVQLQKLLSKVQELERVRINLPTANPRRSSNLESTKAPNLDTAASQRTQHVQDISGAHIVYPTNTNSFEPVAEILPKNADTEDLRLDLPVYKRNTTNPVHSKNKSRDLTSSEELKDLVYSQVPSEEEAYKSLNPPVVHKTVTKEPPRFVATKSPKEVKQKAKANADLEEIQKLLNNAQELKTLGVSLPKELTEKLESKFSQTDNDYSGFKKQQATSTAQTAKKEDADIEEYLQKLRLSNNAAPQTERNVAISPTTASSEEEEELSEKTAVFSLTTMKAIMPRPSKTTTESSVELPVFSATKIIEAAIKRAADRIGFSTEGPAGFRRREDTMVDESTDDMKLGVRSGSDLVADFSEINYQLAAPDKERDYNSRVKDLHADFSEPNVQVAPLDTTERKREHPPDLTANTDELQRLIKNLQELKNLNLSPNDKHLLRQADLKYLENLKSKQTPADDTIKMRRQSNQPTEETTSNMASATETATATATSTTTQSSRIQLDLSLDASDATKTGDTENDTSTTTAATEESRNGSLSDLEDSFGPNPITESPPPPKKKNGFYFLADWNSFLEVGDGDDQVVVRLSPKIGDPRLFLPVKIP